MKPLVVDNNENELMCCDFPWNRPGETFCGRLSINFEEIPSRAFSVLTSSKLKS